jgi:hypothetical protein
MKAAVFPGLFFRGLACPALACETKVDDVAHRAPLYFLRKASSETTSAPLPSSLAGGAASF